jgi:hypothetical protein
MLEEGECFPCRFHYCILRPIFLDLRWIAIMVTATFEMPIMRPQPRPFLYCSIMQSYENASDPKRPTLCCIAKSTLAHLLNRADFPTFGRPTSMTFDSSSVDGCRSRCKAFFPDVPMLAVFFVVLSTASETPTDELLGFSSCLSEVCSWQDLVSALGKISY